MIAECHVKVKIIEFDQKSYTAEDFINERVVNRNLTSMLYNEINSFNEMQREIARRDGVNTYECVYIGRHNPNINEDFYYPYIGKVEDFTIWKR